MSFLDYFEQVPVDLATAVFKFGIGLVGDMGTLLIDLVKAVVPGGARP